MRLNTVANIDRILTKVEIDIGRVYPYTGRVWSIFVAALYRLWQVFLIQRANCAGLKQKRP